LLDSLLQEILNMGRTDEVLSIKIKLEKLVSKDKDSIASKAPDMIRTLSGLKLDLKVLEKTKIGFTLDKVRKETSDEAVKKSAKELLKKWHGLNKKSSTEKSAPEEKTESAVAPDWEATAPLPTRNKKGQMVFQDAPEFRPNLSPKEVLQLGSFGGTYFRPIHSSVTKKKYGSEVWEELPKDWLEGLTVRTQVASIVYTESKNKYNVKCGASLEEWENSGWMREQDPYGWFQWYCRFYQGRRTEDDERQIGRWKKCAGEKGRWKNNLISKIAKAGVAFDNYGVSPVVRQTLQHWAYQLTSEDFDKEKKRFQ